jgi:hypothetical protein
MSACPQCGTVAKPTDKFCNVCGTPIARTGASAAAPAPPPAYGAPAPPQYAPPPPGGGFGAAPPPAYGAPGPGFPGAGGPGQAPQAPRCQMGHEIAPGASYCSQGHPIALDQMQFTSDAYGGGYGAPGAQPGFAPAPPQQGPYGAPPPQPPPVQGFGPPPQQQGYAPPPPGFGPQQPSPGFGPPPAQGFPPAGQPGFGPPQPAPAYGIAAPAAPQPVYGGTSDTSRDAVPAKILRGFLVAYGTNASGDFWPLTGGRLTVGRLGGADGIDVSLQDPTISSRHAALVIDASSGSITVEDTGSTNGTFVNDEHIGFNGRRDLRDGDRLRFGGFTTVVKVIGRV